MQHVQLRAGGVVGVSIQVISIYLSSFSSLTELFFSCLNLSDLGPVVMPTSPPETQEGDSPRASGPGLQRCARSIRAACVHCPAQPCDRAWHGVDSPRIEQILSWCFQTVFPGSSCLD